MTNTIELHDAEPSKGVKSFGLKRPCSNCPFRKDLEKNRGWLGEARAAGIAKDSFFYLYDFPCHKTTSSDDEYDYWDDEDECDHHHTGRKAGPNEIQCAGVSIMQVKLGIPSQRMQLAERLGLAEREGLNDLDLESPVFDSVQDFIDFHK